MGFKQGGTAGFGLRRMLVDQAGQQKAMLKMGEQKSLQTDRVILVPGPEDEVKMVRWIYRVFLEDGKTGIGNRGGAERPGGSDRLRACLDERDRSPGAHQ